MFRMALGICFDWYLHIIYIFCLAVLHIIQTKTSRCSYHANKISNLETMVCEKVERMEYMHLSIPYKIE
jgi:hypothetical protein